MTANQYAQGPFSPHLLGKISIPYAAINKMVKITGKHNRKGVKKTHFTFGAMQVFKFHLNRCHVVF